MLRRWIPLLVVLAIPALAPAEQVWRWRDGAGRLHYSNIASLVPEDAVAVTTQITRAPAERASAPAAVREPHRAGPPPRWGTVGEYAPVMAPVPLCCGASNIPWLLTVQGRDDADQVKQASLYDMLGINWRSGFCP